MPEENLELDHVLIVVADLAEAGREIEERYGLASIEGGRHPGWGTANRIVPLGETYLELIAVVDEDEAAQSPFGTWVARGTRPALAQPLGWAVRTRALDDVAGRLGLEVSSNSRPTGDGRVLRWRLAGVEAATAEPSRPILIEWGDDTPVPGRTPISHPAGPMELTKLHLAGDADRVADWLGDHDLPIEVKPGTPAVTKIVLSGTAGEAILEGERP